MAEQPPRILVVDDRRANLLSMRKVLSRVGAEVLTARSGGEALWMMTQSDFALVLLDDQMPDLDGFETATRIRGSEKLKYVPIILVTATSGDEKYLLKGYAAGAVDFLFKPVDPIILQSKVKVFLELYRQKQDLLQSLAELAGRNEELQRFAHIAAHDLKSPLGRVAKACGFLRRENDGKLDGDSQELLDMAVRNANQMTMLVDELLEYATAGRPGKPAEPVELGVVVGRALENLQAYIEDREAKVAVASMPRVLGHETGILQVLQNLIANAIKFTDGRAPVVKLSSHFEGGAWRISVEDNGIGIEPEHCNKIFTAFNRLHGQEYEGSGIGLATCKKIVEQHGGRIWVESQVGEGSTVHFTLLDAGSRQSTRRGGMALVFPDCDVGRGSRREGVETRDPAVVMTEATDDHAPRR